MPPPSCVHLGLARRALGAGGVIACPTEAVWGLSCDPEDELAVARLLQHKDRPVEKGLILVASSQNQVEFLLDGLSVSQRATLSASWPGPNTWIVPHRGRVPPWVSGEHDSVALRVTAHPALRALCEAFGGPLVSTSANPAGADPARTSLCVRKYFGDNLAYILPGRLGDQARPSVIRDLASGDVLRA